MTDRIVLEPERRSITGISGTTCWRLERKGEFPGRVILMRNKLGVAIRVGWKLSELQAWIDSREVLQLKPSEDRAATAASH